MKTPSTSTLTIFTLLLIFSCSCHGQEDFLRCLFQASHNYSSISNVVYTTTNSSYTSILQFSIRNHRFATESTPKPQVIITPEHESQITPVIYCAKHNGLEIKTRSGGHDLEGLSYVSRVPFVIIDLINLSEITVDVEEKIAWVGAGATLGALYYSIAEKSSILGFPGGLCLTVGVGGHFSGGGFGTMLRKFGLAADQIIDARIVNVQGHILDRKSMGEDLFWAIRGGGGASFGVIVAWKVQLVDVPKAVTVFSVDRSLEQNAIQLVHRWQYIAPKLDRDLFIGIVLTRVNLTQEGRNVTVNASFYSHFLGGVDRLLALMQESFPELGVVREDCSEMSWIQSALYLSHIPIPSATLVLPEPLEVLLNRTPAIVANYKIKSDYVEKPISEYVLEGLVKLLYDLEGDESFIDMNPWGGRMDEISESATPYPHRAGNLYFLSSLAIWDDDEAWNSNSYISWSRRYYSYLTPYVSKNPRGAYLNYRDLDIGVNNIEGYTSYAQASIWGKKYFKNNFDRLVWVKTLVDPSDFFKNEQSIPSVDKHYSSHYSVPNMAF